MGLSSCCVKPSFSARKRGCCAKQKQNENDLYLTPAGEAIASLAVVRGRVSRPARCVGRLVHDRGPPQGRRGAAGLRTLMELAAVNSPAAALVAGLVTSLHCAAMCGPLSCALMPGRGDRSDPTTVSTVYHLSRLAGYAMLGALAGGIGR